MNKRGRSTLLIFVERRRCPAVLCVFRAPLTTVYNLTSAISHSLQRHAFSSPMRKTYKQACKLPSQCNRAIKTTTTLTLIIALVEIAQICWKQSCTGKLAQPAQAPLCMFSPVSSWYGTSFRYAHSSLWWNWCGNDHDYMNWNSMLLQTTWLHFIAVQDTICVRS